MDDLYHVSVGGEKLGPFSEAQLRERFDRGDLEPWSLCVGENCATPRSLAAEFPEWAWRPERSRLAVMSVGLGIAAMLLMPLLLMPLLTAPAAIVCGHLARRNIKRAKGALCGGGLALAGLITGYVALPLEGAVLVPAFCKVRRHSEESVMMSDARQLAAAARIYLDGKETNQVGVGYDPSTGAITGPLQEYLHGVRRGYTLVPERLTKESTFQLALPKVGVMTFDADGRLVHKEPTKP